jgi:hypothetical protein
LTEPDEEVTYQPRPPVIAIKPIMIARIAFFRIFIFWANVKEYRPSPAGASVGTEVDVHDTGDFADKAAGDGCCVSFC